MFRKITANDPKFKFVLKQHKELIEEFRIYAENETIKVNKKSSGKPSSYSRYLVRLIIFHQEFSPEDTHIFYKSSEGVDALQSLRRKDGFTPYNKNENHFPGSTLNCYERFIVNLKLNSEAEEITDLELNNISNHIYNIKESKIVIKETPVTYYARVKDEKVNYRGRNVYPRNVNEAIQSKINNQYKCENDIEHITFTNNSDKQPFMEAHHLIPMAFQDDFEYSIDFSDNIVCLCPNCHRLIHHGEVNDKADLITHLYNKRNHKYSEYKIDINLEKLFQYYGIDSKLLR